MDGSTDAPTGASWPRLRDRVIQQAEREGLIEIAFETHDSPFGPLLVAASDAGLVRVALPAEQQDQVLEDLARRVSPRIVRTARPEVTAARIQLDQYFTGQRRRFQLGLDWRLTDGFRRDVLHQTAAIPYGRTASYTEMARRAGRPAAVRATGTALATNPLPVVVPCHRVLRSDGSPGGYLGGPEMKVALLAMEREA